MHGFSDWRNIVVASTLCRQGDVIVEVGANIGTETISFLDIVGPRGEVLALEPDPNLIERLLRNLSDADTTALKPLNVAAGDTPAPSDVLGSGSRPAVAIRRSDRDGGQGLAWEGWFTLGLIGLMAFVLVLSHSRAIFLRYFSNMAMRQ